MPRQNRFITPITSLPQTVDPATLIFYLNTIIEQINTSFASVDQLESELRGEDGNTVSFSSDVMLSGGTIRGIRQSQAGDEPVSRAEMEKNSIYVSRGVLQARKPLSAMAGISVPRAQRNEDAIPKGQADAMMSGFVQGPASSTDNVIALWDGTTGRLLKDSSRGSAIASLTDNSGGTANDTVEALPDPADAPATADALRDDLVANLIPALRNDIADLTAKVNAILTALRIHVIAT